MPEPTDPPTLALALEHHRAGRLAEAEAIYTSLLAAHPGHPELLHLLGLAAHQAGRSEAGANTILQAIAGKPDSALYHNNLGVVLASLGQYDQARAAHEMAIKLQPEYPEAFYNLGNVRRARGEWDDAVAAFRMALSQRPGYAPALDNLGGALRELGLLDAALACFRQCLAIEPASSRTHSNLIYTTYFHPDFTADAIAMENRQWSRCHAEPLKPECRRHDNDRSNWRRLRVGYVSPDFFDQAESFFVLPLLEAHAREQVEVHAYASVSKPDAITARLQCAVDRWHDVGALSDADLAEKIRGDGIDVLVDLTMHMARNRLLVFARKPAPVQVAWLAYPGSTGLDAIDYRITDSFMEPADTAALPWPEQPIRLPDSWCCYHPRCESPDPGALPALANGAITFGSLNQSCKANERVLALWARVLATVPDSRLRLMMSAGSHRERTRQLFKARGIDEQRIEFAERVPRDSYLRSFRDLDIALDPFPYNGITTTCDALWMGVPVISLVGELPAARAGLSLLTTIGLPELAARTEDQYVQIAADLSADLPKLAARRATLRTQMQCSPLMDAPHFARNVERAYREMWRAWCVGRMTNDE